MKYCPITYDVIKNEETYSRRGLNLLSPQLKQLLPLNLSAIEQRTEAIERVGKMSIQGIQPKLSAKLSIKNSGFTLVDQFGRYILKPQHQYYLELPENEAISMTLAETMGVDIPAHGLIFSKDRSMTYFIKRFDREGHTKKFAVEDFAQLSGRSRDTKYDSSMENVIKIVEKFCSFPKLELFKLFKLTIFNFLIGNEDMHLKNFSLITLSQKIMLSPAYDLLNTTIVQKNVKEELALPLNGKKNNLTKNDFIYFASRMGLQEGLVKKTLQEVENCLPKWIDLLNRSFLSAAMKEKYIKLLTDRYKRVISS